jgi:hypothetical protein
MSDLLAPNGQPWPERLRWFGSCNQCGWCCTIDVQHNGQPMRLVCENLRVYLSGGQPLPLGHPQATKCAVYERRQHGMPIKMLDATGTPRMVGQCGKDHWLEDERILVRGQGKGCSLTLTNPGDVPVGQFIPTGDATP